MNMPMKNGTTTVLQSQVKHTQPTLDEYKKQQPEAPSTRLYSHGSFGNMTVGSPNMTMLCLSRVASWQYRIELSVSSPLL